MVLLPPLHLRRISPCCRRSALVVFASVLPDVRTFVVSAHGWRDGSGIPLRFLALSQAIPGPNMILMMSFVGWKVWGIPGAIASAIVTFGPPCVMYFVAYRNVDRFLGSPWQHIVRVRLLPVIIGLVIAGGVVMARAADAGWQAAVVTIVAALLMLQVRLNPILILLAGGHNLAWWPRVAAADPLFLLDLRLGLLQSAESSGGGIDRAQNAT